GGRPACRRAGHLARRIAAWATTPFRVQSHHSAGGKMPPSTAARMAAATALAPLNTYRTGERARVRGASDSILMASHAVSPAGIRPRAGLQPLRADHVNRALSKGHGQTFGSNRMEHGHPFRAVNVEEPQSLLGIVDAHIGKGPRTPEHHRVLAC